MITHEFISYIMRKVTEIMSQDCAKLAERISTWTLMCANMYVRIIWMERVIANVLTSKYENKPRIYCELIKVWFIDSWSYKSDYPLLSYVNLNGIVIWPGKQLQYHQYKYQNLKLCNVYNQA